MREHPTIGHSLPNPAPAEGLHSGHLGCEFITSPGHSPDRSDSPPARRRADRLKVGPKVSHRRGAVVGCGDVSFRWVIEPLAGAEGREVRTAQARAIRELARWLTQVEQGHMEAPD